MKFNHFLLPQDASAPFHTSGYARVAQGSNIGATSSEAFQVRLQREGARQVVGRYADSHLARTYASRPVQGRPEIGPTQRSPITPRKAVTPASNRQPMQFREPPARGYNPYT